MSAPQKVRKAKASPSPASVRDARGALFSNLSSVAKEFGSFTPATVALESVRAVPTIFPDFDLRTRVGGLPIERFTLVHGPSGGGKSYYCIGLMLSFLMLGHPVLFIDAERTTPAEWLRTAMGPFADHPLFFAVNPTTYEKTREQVREFCNKIARLRKSGKLPPDATGLVVLDSIRKLVPKDFFDMVMRETRAAGQKPQGARDRLAQIKAQMNTAWLDELVVLLDETKTAMVAIAREMVDTNVTDDYLVRQGLNVKTGGGVGLFYDASLDLRIKLWKPYGKRLKAEREGERGKLQIYGDIHEVAITKSKVSGKGEVYRARANFHISNGVWTPEGFDRARDLLAVARRLDVVEGTGWLTFAKKRFRSEDIAVRAMTEDPTLMAAIDRETRALFKQVSA